MKKLFTIIASEKFTLFLGIIVVVLLLGMTTSIALFVCFRNRWREVEPEVTILPKNNFDKSLRVVADKDYKPFSYCLEDSQPRGYDVELAAELLNRLGYNMDLKLVSWSEAVELMQTGGADMILGCDWQDTAIMTDCNFTIPTYEEQFVVFQLAPLKNFSELYKKKIAVIEGCGLKDTLERYQLWQRCEEYETVTGCVKAVINNECDCFIAHRTIGEICLRKFGMIGKKFRGRLDIANGQMCFGVAKNNRVLFRRINEILLGIRAVGITHTLERKWLERFSDTQTFKDYMRKNPMVFISMLYLGAIVILILLTMSYYLIRIQTEKNRVIEAERAKALFFSTVSHDIRTPLNAIIGFSELLKNGISDEKERQNALNIITTSGNTLLELVNDVLNLSKLETNKMVFNTQLTDVPRLASSVLHSFDIMVPSKAVKLSQDYSEMPSLYVDQNRIRQILYNLLSNAVKFTERGDIRLKGIFVKIDHQDEGTGTLSLSVSDTGCGITPENQRKLMQPFVQIQGKQTEKGTGLGLYICKQLAMRMGGDLTLESVFGKGSTFTLTLRDVRFSSKQQVVGEEASKEVKNNFEHLRILIVDDIPVNRRVLEAMLKRLDIKNITAAENGVEALKNLYSFPDGFDVVLTDMWMPEMDGKALIGEIRKNARWKTLPVFAVTADIEAQNTSIDYGFTGLLLKPVTLEKLRDLLS